VAAFSDHPLSDLLEEVAAQSPAPGGGCASAWSAAMGAGLAEMAASFTLARPRFAGVHHRMLEIRRQCTASRRRLVELAEEDAENYAPVLAAMRLPAKHRDRERRLAEAQSRAADTPLAIAETAAEVAELAAETARGASEHLQGDAITGALLAEAASRAATRLVEINLLGRADERVTRALEAARRAGAAREEALRVREEVFR